MKRVIIILISIVSLGFSYGQDKSVPFKKEFFKERKDEFKVAMKDLNAGLDIYEKGEYYWKGAIYKLEKANVFNPNNAQLNYRLGNCYLHSAEKLKSLKYFLKAYELRPTIAKDIHYKIGKGYQLNYEFDKAKDEFEIHRMKLEVSETKELLELDKLVAECTRAKELMTTPVRVWVDNVGGKINSKYPEYGPLITADESMMIFTSRRPSETSKEQEGGHYNEDVFISKKDENGNWTQALSISDKINTKEHDATAGLSNDGKILFLYTSNAGGDLNQSLFVDGEWSKPKNLGKKINGDLSWDSGASLSYDGKELYFISNREGTRGERDIWVSKWNEKKGIWGEASNVGPKVNTIYDEIGVFMHPDGETMYFSSDGHKGMGGYDIFFSKKQDDGTWGKPQNIGYPVNTTDDDLHFIMAANGKHGYYSSYRDEGGDDIFMISFLGKPKEPLMSGEDNLLAGVAAPIEEKMIQAEVELEIANNLTILKGVILDEETKQPISATLELVDNGAQKTISSFSSDGKTGNFLLSLPAGKNYGIAVNAEGYLFHSENFDIPESAGYTEFEKVFYLKKIEVGKSIVLRNIFFDLDRSTIKPISKLELDRLIELLTENKTLRVEISGHTDTQGSASYNTKLSQNRAKAVVDYLVKAGFESSRFEYKGYGEESPIISDEEISKISSRSERKDAHAVNRRTEFKILSY